MFSLDKFYDIIHNNLISKMSNGKSIYFTPFGTYDRMELLYEQPPFTAKYEDKTNYYNHNLSEFGRMGVATFTANNERIFFHCYFFDQEPLYADTLPIIENSIIGNNSPDITVQYGSRRHHILAISEKSEFVRQLCRTNYYYDWYYFYHGFAALDWYKNFEYLDPTVFEKFDKVFICYNHLISNYRSYRLHLVSNLLDRDLVKHGLVSLFLNDARGSWKDEISNKNSLLDKRAKIKVYQALKDRSEPLVIDTDVPNGSLSANVNFNDLTRAFWHIVTETIYFFSKLHLTEKVFKPIIAQRPFILVAAPGNLAYLKSYGFKTFDRWIDESYDQEQDHYVRIEKITAEIDKLCALSMPELKQMHQEMQEVLQFNYNHFYGDFKRIIVNELVDNFEGILNRINNGRQPNNHSKWHQIVHSLTKEQLADVKQRLLK